MDDWADQFYGVEFDEAGKVTLQILPSFAVDPETIAKAMKGTGVISQRTRYKVEGPLVQHYTLKAPVRDAIIDQNLYVEQQVMEAIDDAMLPLYQQFIPTNAAEATFRLEEQPQAAAPDGESIIAALRRLSMQEVGPLARLCEDLKITITIEIDGRRAKS